MATLLSTHLELIAALHRQAAFDAAACLTEQLAREVDPW